MYGHIKKEHQSFCYLYSPVYNADRSCFTSDADRYSSRQYCKAVYVCYSENKEILKRSKTLREYSLFISYVNENLDKGMDLEDAVAAAVKRAKRAGILVDFLNKYATELTI